MHIAQMQLHLLNILLSGQSYILYTAEPNYPSGITNASPKASPVAYRHNATARSQHFSSLFQPLEGPPR